MARSPYFAPNDQGLGQGPVSVTVLTTLSTRHCDGFRTEEGMLGPGRFIVVPFLIAESATPGALVSRQILTLLRACDQFFDRPSPPLLYHPFLVIF